METSKTYWHLYSDGKRADVPFGTDQLKVFAVNSIAICASSAGAVVLCFDVNDTHLHIVIFATDVVARRFRDKLLVRLSRHYTVNACSELLGDGFFLACDRIIKRDDVLTRIIYTFRNCLDFYNKVPWDYGWGVGNLYFSERKDRVPGRRLSEISRRAQIALLHTQALLPQDWEYNTDGMLLPSSFVDYRHVEQLFGTPRAFLAFLFVRKEDEQHMKQEFSSRYIRERSIQEMRDRGNSLCNSNFGKSLRAVPFESRLKIAASMLKEGSGSKTEGFAKALYLKREDIEMLL